jgi:hypothetical protein
MHNATYLLNEATRLLHLATECSDRSIRRKLNRMADRLVDEAARASQSPHRGTQDERNSQLE